MKEKLRQFLTNTDRFPKALVFLGRNMRMIQGKCHSISLKLILYFAANRKQSGSRLTCKSRKNYWALGL